MKRRKSPSKISRGRVAENWQCKKNLRSCALDSDELFHYYEMNFCLRVGVLAPPAECGVVSWRITKSCFARFAKLELKWGRKKKGRSNMRCDSTFFFYHFLYFFFNKIKRDRRQQNMSFLVNYFNFMRLTYSNLQKQS